MERFPVDVQQAAAARRVVFLIRFAIIRSASATQRKKYGGEGQAAPVTELLEALAEAPSDVLQEIVKFVGEGAGEATLEQRVARMERGVSLMRKEQRKGNEAQTRENERLRRENGELRRAMEELRRENEELQGGG